MRAPDGEGARRAGRPGAGADTPGPNGAASDPFDRYATADPSARHRQRRTDALAAGAARRPSAHPVGAPVAPATMRLRRGLGRIVAPPAESADSESDAPPASGPALEWIELVLVDGVGQPVADEPYRVRLPDGGVREGRLDAEGRARLDGVAPGRCEVTFPELDAAEWRRA